MRFLGRTISRKAADAALYLSVDPDYMDECFREFGIEKGSTTFPAIRPAIEETVDQEPISAEAHARFRRILGRLSWMCQTRLDLLILVGLLSTGQASPKPGHEKALRMVLRYLITDMKVGQRFPTEGDSPTRREAVGLHRCGLCSHEEYEPSQHHRCVPCVPWCTAESVQPASGIGDLEFVRGRTFRRPGRHPGPKESSNVLMSPVLRTQQML